MTDAEFRKYSDQEPSVVCTTQPPPGSMSPPQYAPQWSGYPPPQTPQPQQQYPMMAPTNQQMHTTNNIIITAQPGATGGRPPQRDWSSGVCDCCSDMSVCLMGWCCPLCLECSIARDLGDPFCDSFLLMCAPAALFGLRANMRGRENIRGTLFDDFTRTTGCCSCMAVCILCQLAREVKFVKAAKGYV
ncbi:hypothetical protein Btru_041633 [Bulinus truncatus]|nr:hypothetical protein Btru_041633 [Bulinus truncatus]